jgi:hypothetical protein
MNSKTLQFFFTLLSVFSLICIPQRMQAQECCEDNQACYDHWLWNRKVLLVAVPVAAGAVAVALATSSPHSSFYTGDAYGSHFFSDSSEFYDYYYSYPSYSEYLSDDYYYSHHSDHHHYDHHHLSDSHLSEVSHHHVARNREILINPVISLEKISGPVTFTASVRGADNSLIESSSLTVEKPGTLNFDPISTEKLGDLYKVELSYVAENGAQVEGELMTTLTSVDGEQTQTSSFKTNTAQVTHDFILANN